MEQRKIDIIYMTLFPWDNEYSSVSLSFTREFVKNNRVFYINHPYSLKDFWRLRKTRLAQKRKKMLLRGKMQYEQIPGIDPTKAIAVQPPLTLPINWLPKGPIHNFLHRVNQRIIYRTIRKVIKDYNLKNYIFLNCYDPYFAGILPKDKFSPLLNIYQCIDDFSVQSYTSRHGARLEKEIMQKADVVVATSSNLVKIFKPYNSNIHLLPNAVDLTIFEKTLTQKLPKPKELQDIHTPIIGFTGNMDDVRFDFELIKHLAQAHKDKTIVLVGPINCDDFFTLGLDKIPNIVHAGSKKIDELPAYLQYFDVALIPFKLNRQTESIYPLKINEYLAAGMPVVSTSFSDDIRSFGKWIYLAKDRHDFVSLIDMAIRENSEEAKKERLAVAKTNTWTERVKRFWKIVEENITENGSR